METLPLLSAATGATLPLAWRALTLFRARRTPTAGVVVRRWVAGRGRTELIFKLERAGHVAHVAEVLGAHKGNGHALLSGTTGAT